MSPSNVRRPPLVGHLRNNFSTHSFHRRDDGSETVSPILPPSLHTVLSVDTKDLFVIRFPCFHRGPLSYDVLNLSDLGTRVDPMEFEKGRLARWTPDVIEL